MAKVEVRDIEIAYNIDGSGEPVVLIGGFTMVKEAWEFQVAELAKHFRVITFDNRGVGETAFPTGPFSVADMAADTAGLLDALGIDAAHFFGVSMGGLIAQILALDYPERVKKAALGCTTHGGRHAVQPEREVMEILGKASDPTIPVEEAVRLRLPVIFAERFIREEPERLEEFVQLSTRYWPTSEGAAGQLGALSVFNVKKRLGEIRCPVLAITGSEDRMMPPENSRLLAEGIAGAAHYVVDGTGHSFFLEKPDEVNGVLIDFFSK
ncbi:MAG: alpha/beta fold hydrolase [Deltaproteobacteria bacterium]|nr:alpha/beta fold hydrolase [Deltaproteobacteria bacterium]